MDFWPYMVFFMDTPHGDFQVAVFLFSRTGHACSIRDIRKTLLHGRSCMLIRPFTPDHVSLRIAIHGEIDKALTA